MMLAGCGMYFNILNTAIFLFVDVLIVVNEKQYQVFAKLLESTSLHIIIRSTR